MLFTSNEFLYLFFPIALSLYLLVRNRIVVSNVLLVILSFIFYYQGGKVFTLLLVAMILINYGIGRWMDRPGANRKGVAALGVVVNLVPMVFFKYTGFLVENINLLLGLAGVNPIVIGRIPLPLGISFFTFQAITYIVDVYRGTAPVQKSLLNLSLYISLFPKMTQGPITRYADIASQLTERRFTIEGFAEGVKRFIVGLAKKMLVANVVGSMVDTIFSLAPGEMSAPLAWLGVFGYIMQIYFDFSGYSDMAIGIGRMLGFTFMENFDYPFISRSMREFWQRWHISLLSWMRDYLYFPLGGSRVSAYRHYLNLIIVYFVVGLWHNASWNYIIWGTMNGIIVVLERQLPDKFFDALWRPVGALYTTLTFMMGAVFFRSATVSYAGKMFVTMFGGTPAEAVRYTVTTVVTPEMATMTIIGWIGWYPLFPVLRRAVEGFVGGLEGRRGDWCRGLWSAFSIAVLVALAVLSFMAVASESFTPFLYIVY